VLRVFHWSLWSRPSMLWAAHASPIAWAVIMPAASVGPYVVVWPSRSWLNVAMIVTFTGLAAMMLGHVCVMCHDPEMCHRCKPHILLPGMTVSRGVRVALWLQHQRESLLLAPAGVLAAGLIVWHRVEWPPWWASVPSMAVAGGCLGGWGWSQLVHHAHRQWCVCRAQDRDDHPETPPGTAPDPTSPGGVRAAV
jgi:hypothetical protein